LGTGDTIYIEGNFADYQFKQNAKTITLDNGIARVALTLSSMTNKVQVTTTLVFLDGSVTLTNGKASTRVSINGFDDNDNARSQVLTNRYADVKINANDSNTTAATYFSTTEAAALVDQQNQAYTAAVLEIYRAAHAETQVARAAAIVAGNDYDTAAAAVIDAQSASVAEALAVISIEASARYEAAAAKELLVATELTRAAALTTSTVDNALAVLATDEANAAVIDSALATEYAILDEAAAEAVVAGYADLPTNFALTVNPDTFVGTTGDNVFNAATTGTLSAFDNLTGGEGTDTLNAYYATALDTTVLGLTITGMENVTIQGNANITTDVTTWGTTALSVNTNGSGGFGGAIVATAAATTAVTALNSSAGGAITVTGGLSQTVTANGGVIILSGSVGAVSLTDTSMLATAVTINGGTSVSSTTTGATTGIVTIGNLVAPTGAVTVNHTASGASTAATGAIAVTGGSTVSVTETVTNTTAGAVGANGVVTQGNFTVTGTANTTSVTVNQSNVAAVTGVAAVTAVTESASVVMDAGGMTVGEDYTLAGLTLTAAGTLTAAQVAAAYANLFAGSTSGNVTGGTWTGALTGYNTGAVNTATVVFTSTIPGNVADLTPAATGATAAAATITAGVAGVAAVTGVTGVATGGVTITDVNAASLTAAGTITSVSLNNFGAATANSGALTSVTLAGTGTSFTQTNGALTTATALNQTLTLNGASVGTVALGAVPTTLNIVSGGGAAVTTTLTAASATAVNISGSSLFLAADTFASTAVITSTSTGGVTLAQALTANQQFVGTASSGADNIGVTTAFTKAITTGEGNDTVTYGGAAGTGGSIDAGAGTADTIIMTAADAVTATASTTFAGKVSNFEVLQLSAATGAAAAINMANADGINSLTIAGATVGALTVTNAAANFTFTQNALTSFASSIALATNTVADNVNLVFSAANGFTNSAAYTIAGVETLTITTADTDGVANTAAYVAPITAANVITVTVAGAVGIDLTGLTATTLTSLNASGLTGTGTAGGLVWTSGVTTAAATITGSAAGTNIVNLSAATVADTYIGGTGNDMVSIGNALANTITLGNGTNVVNGAATGNNTVTGGTGADTFVTATVGNNIVNFGDGANAFTATTGNNTYTGGTGVDTVTVGGGVNTITSGTGADVITFTAVVANGNAYSTITDAHATLAIVSTDAGQVSGTTTFNATQITLASTAAFADYLNAASAADGSTNSVVSWFQYLGNTYIVEDNAALTTFSNGVDSAIALTGLQNLSNDTFAAVATTSWSLTLV
jgi:S-layer protein